MSAIKLRDVLGFTISAHHPRTNELLASYTSGWNPKEAANGEYTQCDVPFIKEAAKIAMKRRGSGFKKAKIKFKFYRRCDSLHGK